MVLSCEGSARCNYVPTGAGHPVGVNFNRQQSPPRLPHQLSNAALGPLGGFPTGSFHTQLDVMRERSGPHYEVCASPCDTYPQWLIILLWSIICLDQTQTRWEILPECYLLHLPLSVQRSTTVLRQRNTYLCILLISVRVNDKKKTIDGTLLLC